MKIFSNPFMVYLAWIILLTISSVLTLVFTLGFSGGEQKPLIFISYLINVGIYGFLLISLLTTVIYFSWFKKIWFVNLIIVVITLYLIVPSLISKNRTVYDFEEIKQNFGKKELIKRTEFYINTKKIRSEQFFLDNKKDSIWVVYDFNGNIISKEIFRNDSLLIKEK